MDVQGVCKSTVVRGEGGFPGGTLRVSDCHDTVVYALAPLQVGISLAYPNWSGSGCESKKILYVHLWRNGD